MRGFILFILLSYTALADAYDGKYYSCEVTGDKSMCLATVDKDLATLCALVALDSIRYMTDNQTLLERIFIKLPSGTILFYEGLQVLQCIEGTKDHNEFKECISDIVEVGKET
jgi:hypothetical protein